MIITLEQDSPVPLYLQIYNKIVSSIAAGEIKTGDILPSSRKLAKDLGINYHTVNKAFNLLISEGLVSMRKKRVEVILASAENKEDFLRRFEIVERELINEARAKGIEDKVLSELINSILEGVVS